MGIPAFFRWLCKKYTSVVINCIEEKAKVVDGVKIPVDITGPNPNDFEFDNLYLDMNGIIHPCCHPENKPAPSNEEEMMEAIFEYVDRLVAIVRPRKLLYMAIDGVAPRAKMNQQRSRRFRAAKESSESREKIAKVKMELRMRGVEIPPDKPDKEHFDSNCITPGTEFMFRLAECLRYYVHVRTNSDPGWLKLMVILSDANVPGEGEHKIMDFIRRQKAQSDYDPNIRHCLCGADADLIMLGLATHEPNFTIIREEFKPFREPPCEICGQIGHKIDECTGVAKGKQNESDVKVARADPDQDFLFVRLNVLREHLYRELTLSNVTFKENVERAIDDWVMICFFVGNDFLPHIPSLEIGEGAIDKLIGLYKNVVCKTGGYMTDRGYVHLARLQHLLTDLGSIEDDIFKKRIATKEYFKKKNEAKRQKGSHNQDWTSCDDVRLGEEGWKDRYYEYKFGKGKDANFRNQLAYEYVLGICWVLRYYYQGCASWTWYFPYHYAPFASDFVDIPKLNTLFPRDTEPIKPLEQLMSVLPAASKKFLPPSWQELMCKEESRIIDFYPTDFKIDLNGKAHAWQGVALLPFVNECRLLDALKCVQENLTEDEKKRNSLGNDLLFLHCSHNFFACLESLYTNRNTNKVLLNKSHTCGFSGLIWCDDNVVLTGDVVKSPLSRMDDFKENRTLCVGFLNPQYHKDFIFPSKLLANAKVPPPVLTDSIGGNQQQFDYRRPTDNRSSDGQYERQVRPRQYSRYSRGRGDIRPGYGQYRPGYCQNQYQGQPRQYYSRNRAEKPHYSDARMHPYSRRR